MQPKPSTHHVIAQISKSALAVPKPACQARALRWRRFDYPTPIHAQPVGKPAIRQAGKPALRGLRPAIGTAATPVLVAQVSKPAVSQVSKPACQARALRRRRFDYPAPIHAQPVGKPAIPQAGKPALRGLRRVIGTAPTPVFGPGTQTGVHGIVPDISGNARLFLFRADPMIKVFSLPKRAFSQTNDLHGLSRAKLFPRLDYVPEQMAGHGPYDGMHMVWHDHPFLQQITLLMKMPQDISKHACNLFSPQMAYAHSPVKAVLQFSLKVARNFSSRINHAAFFSQLSFRTDLFLFKLQQHFPGQGIRQSEGDKISSAFSFYMRQIAAIVNAGTEWINDVFHAIRTQLMAHTIQTWIRFIRYCERHGNTLAKTAQKSEHCPLGVSQVSKPACQARALRWRIIDYPTPIHAQPVGKPAIQQAGKPALRGLRPAIGTAATPVLVAQVPKPACQARALRWRRFDYPTPIHARPVGKPAIRQAGKPALRGLRPAIGTAATPALVAQVSKPAVSQVSKPACQARALRWRIIDYPTPIHAQPVGKPAIQSAGEACATTARRHHNSFTNP